VFSEYTRKIPITVLRLLFQHSALNHVISHLPLQSFAPSDRARIIRKQDNPRKDNRDYTVSTPLVAKYMSRGVTVMPHSNYSHYCR